MPYNFPNELLAALVRRDCVVVVGAGVSAASTNDAGTNPVTWPELITKLANLVQDENKRAQIVSIANQGDLTMAAEIASALLGKDRICDVLEEELIGPGFRPNDCHRHLASLAQNVYITPNYDTIFDTYILGEYSNLGASIKHQGQTDIVPWLRKNNVLVIKIHGTINDRDTIVLTRRDYVKQRVLNAGFYEVVNSLFLLRTVLFVGCGVRDPDFELIMENAALAFPGAPKHFMIKQRNPASELNDATLGDLRNLQMIYYDGDHTELPLLLNELVLDVESRRQAQVTA